MDLCRRWLVDFNAGKTQLVLSDQSDNTGAIDVKMDESVLEEKLFWADFLFQIRLGSYIISIAKTAYKKSGALTHSMKFLSPEVTLYLYKSTIWPCMKYYCHAWTGAPSCCLELLNKLQKQVCITVGLNLLPLMIPWLIVEM